MSWANWTQVFLSIWLILFSIHLTQYWSLHPITLIVLGFVIFISSMFEMMAKQKKEK